MPEELLPVYQIQDFNQPMQRGPHFYLKALEAHLQEHAFIQKPHKHNFYILILITAGSGTHTIDFNTYPVQPNAFFLLSPGQVHSWQLSPDTKGFVVFFSLEFYLLGHPQKKMDSFPFFKALHPSPYFLLSESEKETAGRILKNMQQEYREKAWKNDDVIRNLLDILLINLTRIFRQKHLAESEKTEAFTTIHKLENLIDKHFREHATVSFYADELSLTLKQLNELCKHTFAKTTSNLIQDRIVLEARRLLVHSDLTITQVAAELGYFDNSYFSRFFRKATGQTPEQFRLSLE